MGKSDEKHFSVFLIKWRISYRLPQCLVLTIIELFKNKRVKANANQAGSVIIYL